MIDSIRKLRDILTGHDKRRFALLLGAILVMALLEVVGIASIMPFMQLVSSPEAVRENPWLGELYERLGFSSERAFLLAVGGLVLSLMTLSKLAGALTKWLQHKFVWDSAHSLAMRLLSTYLYQQYAFFLANEPTKLQKQVIGEVQQLVREVLLPLVKLTAQGFVAVMIFTLLIVVDPILAIVVFATLGGSYAVVYTSVRKYLYRLGRTRFQLFRQRFKAVSEIFGSVKAVKIQGCERYFIKKFRKINRQHADLQPRYAVVAEVPQSFIEILAFGGILVILLYLLAVEQSVQDVIPILSLYALAGHRLMPSLQQSFSALTMMRYNRAVLDSIHEDLTSARLTDGMEDGGIDDSLRFTRSVELRNVTFAYGGSEERVVKDIDLTVYKGSRIGIVGATGSGKSTLVDILLGLLRPTMGEVLVDGMPISHRNVRRWQQLAGYVPQEVVLVDDSLARNVAFGLEDHEVDMARVEWAAEVACIRGFIETELPEGYETRVGERGVRLSGGQRQRIGLARALYRRPQLLILDEATSALDGITEKAVMEAISRLDEPMTVVIIAHRLATVKDCDVIYLLEDGRVAHDGRFEDLIETSSVFRGMARTATA